MNVSEVDDTGRPSAAASPRSDSRLLLVSNDAMRARRRPRAILWMWLFQAALSLSVAWPAARAVSSSYGRFRGGDAALFADGGYALVEWVDRETVLRSGFGAVFAVVIAAGFLVGILPFLALVVSLAYTSQDLRPPRLAQVIPYVAKSAFPSVVLLGLGTLAEGALMALALGVASWLEGALEGRLGEARRGAVAIAAFLFLLLVAAVVSVIHDLARVSIVRLRVGAFSAIGAGLAAFRRARLTLFWSWAWRALSGLVLLVGAYAVTTRLGGRPGFALVVLFALHQLVTLARVALRASWLARALRAVDAMPPRDRATDPRSAR